MKTVQLGFKLEPELHLLFVICDYESHVTAHLVVGLLQLCELPSQFLVCFVGIGKLIIDFSLIEEHLFLVIGKLFFIQVELFLMLSLHFTNQYLIVGPAAVLKQDGEDLPNRSLETVFVGTHDKSFGNHVVETQGVNK